MGIMLIIKGATYTPPGATSPSRKINFEGLMTHDKYINTSGSEVTRSGFECTGFVEIPEGAVAISGTMNAYKPNATSGLLSVEMAFYNSSRQFISYYNGMSEELVNLGDNKYVAVDALIPEGAAYVRFSDVYNTSLVPGMTAEHVIPKLAFIMS